jgi:hypothetical protein
MNAAEKWVTSDLSLRLSQLSPFILTLIVYSYATVRITFSSRVMPLVNRETAGKQNVTRSRSRFFFPLVYFILFYFIFLFFFLQLYNII